MMGRIWNALKRSLKPRKRKLTMMGERTKQGVTTIRFLPNEPPEPGVYLDSVGEWQEGEDPNDPKNMG